MSKKKTPLLKNFRPVNNHYNLRPHHNPRPVYNPKPVYNDYYNRRQPIVNNNVRPHVNNNVRYANNNVRPPVNYYNLRTNRHQGNYYFDKALAKKQPPGYITRKKLSNKRIHHIYRR